MMWTAGVCCPSPGCYGPRGSGNHAMCDRHTWNPNAPAMKVTCECPSPDIERLTMFGPDAAQCRRCGSPISIHADTFGDLTPGGTP